MVILDAIVIGAGAAGLTASYELARHGLKIKLLEASGRIGGRMRKTADFTDFPLDLGGAWIHVDPSVLDKIVNNPKVPVNKSKIVAYKPNYRYYWGPDKSWNSEKFPDKDYSFVGSTWFDFFAHYIAPTSAPLLELNSIVDRIDSTSDLYIKVSSKDGRTLMAKNLIITVSMEVLKRADISFVPELPNDKKLAIEKVKFDAGLKAFFKFSKKFYSQAFDTYYTAKEDKADGDRFFYDATYGQSTKENVLGVFIRGDQAESYAKLGAEGIKKKLLSELDLMYDGKASQFYLHHTIANWTQEPFIGGVYSNHKSSKSYNEIKTISSPISKGRIYFAGEVGTRWGVWFRSWSGLDGANCGQEDYGRYTRSP
jgi:monoamine oxidase